MVTYLFHLYFRSSHHFILCTFWVSQKELGTELAEREVALTLKRPYKEGSNGGVVLTVDG